MIDLTKILKNCPVGTKFWSKVHGVVSFQKINLYEDFPIQVMGTHGVICFLSTGQYLIEGECILVPSKDQRDWNKFSAPWYKKEKFNPKTLKPFDKVIARDANCHNWKCDMFSHIIKSEAFPYKCIGFAYVQCIPYNDDTKHLIGTTEVAPEYYRYWEN